jgi:hypothetical protein
MNATAIKSIPQPATFRPIEVSEQKASVIFRRAQHEYNRGLKYSSLQTAKYALKLAERKGEYCRAYVSGYLAQLKLELGQPERALFYALQAVNALDPHDREYAEDLRYYRLLVEYVERHCEQKMTCKLA